MKRRKDLQECRKELLEAYCIEEIDFKLADVYSVIEEFLSNNFMHLRYNNLYIGVYHYIEKAYFEYDGGKYSIFDLLNEWLEKPADINDYIGEIIKLSKDKKFINEIGIGKFGEMVSITASVLFDQGMYYKLSKFISNIDKNISLCNDNIKTIPTNDSKYLKFYGCIVSSRKSKTGIYQYFNKIGNMNENFYNEIQEDNLYFNLIHKKLMKTRGAEIKGQARNYYNNNYSLSDYTIDMLESNREIVRTLLLNKVSTYIKYYDSISKEIKNNQERFLEILRGFIYSEYFLGQKTSKLDDYLKEISELIKELSLDFSISDIAPETTSDKIEGYILKNLIE